MKAKRITMLWSLPIVAGTIALPSAYAQQASTTEWNADPGTPGSWNDTTWTAGVPVADSLAGILNGGTVGVTAATATLEQLLLGGGSTLNLGALLEVAGTNGVPAVVDPPTPAVPATGLYVYQGTINVNSGGDLRVNTGGNFQIGRDTSGNLNLLPGGSITTDRLVNLGNGGTSAFGKLTVSGGTLTHTGATFQVGPNSAVGQVDISGGTVAITGLRVNFGGTDATQVNIVNQTGGDITYNGETAVGWDTVGSATYNLSGGSITTASRLRIGVSNKGDATRINTFNQTDGDVSVTGRVDVGDSPPQAVVNTYDMSGGTLRTTSQVQVGAFGNSSGIFKLRGTADIDLPGLFVGALATNTGTVTVADEARGFITNLEVRNGSYTQAGNLSDIKVTGRLWVGTTQTVSNTATATITDGLLGLPGTIVGNGNTGNATLNIMGGTINTTDRLRVGVTATGSGLTPTNLVNQTGGNVSIIGRLDLGENPGPTNIYQISGGSLTATSNVLVGYFNDGTGTFTVDGTAEVDVPAVVMGENAGTNNVVGTKGTVNLLGGTLTTGQIRVGNGLTADQTLILDGGTIRARTGGTTLIGGNVTTTRLLAGGITFDTDGLDVNTAAVMTGTGGLTKKGLGTLTVNSVQAYTGASRVEKGRLALTQPYLADNGDVYLYTGAVLELAYAPVDPLADPLVYPTDTIGTLYIDGVPQQIGTYGGTGTSAGTVLGELMTGTGALNATSSGEAAEPPVINSITVAGNTATITITGAPNTNYICRFSDDLVTPFEPIMTVPETITTNANGDASFTVDASVAKRFFVVGEKE